ncbi:MAG: hypothetical protein C4K58_02250 [Flavobacteriaceae bacterium]|nr:MAG: hypothetical protein C4K58_02250 [Flavobacteriaceae bacterium]
MASNKFKVGDWVESIQEKWSAKVISINGLWLEVEDSDGFVYRVKEDDFILLNQNPGLYTDYLDPKFKTVEQKKKPAFKTKKKTVTFEIDLHFDAFNDFPSQTPSHQKLIKQIEYAKDIIAKTQGPAEIIFIHGIGQGILEKELVELFESLGLEYWDASYSRYKMGAKQVKILRSLKENL